MDFLSNTHDIFRLLCKTKKKWGLFLSFEPPKYPEDYNDLGAWVKERQKAAPYLTADMLLDQDVPDYGYMYIFFKTKKEMEKHFWLTVGDDGPTGLNHYNGPVKIYALTCDPRGQTLNENT